MARHFDDDDQDPNIAYSTHTQGKRAPSACEVRTGTHTVQTATVQKFLDQIVKSKEQRKTSNLRARLPFKLPDSFSRSVNSFMTSKNAHLLSRSGSNDNSTHSRGSARYKLHNYVQAGGASMPRSFSGGTSDASAHGLVADHHNNHDTDADMVVHKHGENESGADAALDSSQEGDFDDVHGPCEALNSSTGPKSRHTVTRFMGHEAITHGNDCQSEIGKMIMGLQDVHAANHSVQSMPDAYTVTDRSKIQRIISEKSAEDLQNLQTNSAQAQVQITPSGKSGSRKPLLSVGIPDTEKEKLDTKQSEIASQGPNGALPGSKNRGVHESDATSQQPNVVAPRLRTSHISSHLMKVEEDAGERTRPANTHRVRHESLGDSVSNNRTRMDGTTASMIGESRGMKASGKDLRDLFETYKLVDASALPDDDDDDEDDETVLQRSGGMDQHSASRGYDHTQWEERHDGPLSQWQAISFGGVEGTGAGDNVNHSVHKSLAHTHRSSKDFPNLTRHQGASDDLLSVKNQMNAQPISKDSPNFVRQATRYFGDIFTDSFTSQVNIPHERTPSASRRSSDSNAWRVPNLDETCASSRNNQIRLEKVRLSIDSHGAARDDAVNKVRYNTSAL